MRRTAMCGSESLPPCMFNRAGNHETKMVSFHLFSEANWLRIFKKWNSSPQQDENLGNYEVGILKV